MSSATAMLVALVLGTILNRPGPTPGADGILETVGGSISISDASTTGTVTISLEGDYTGTSEMRIGLSKRISLSASANDPGQVTLEVQNKAVGSFDVEATLANAPGAGETTTVDVDAIVAGLPAG